MTRGWLGAVVRNLSGRRRRLYCPSCCSGGEYHRTIWAQEGRGFGEFMTACVLCGTQWAEGRTTLQAALAVASEERRLALKHGKPVAYQWSAEREKNVRRIARGLGVKLSDREVAA
jgi:hypothetical protein